MAAINALTALPATKQLGNQTVFILPIKVEVAEGSFLHVGGTPSPLTEKKQPVFSVDGQPVIPASSFKGAFRQQVEALLIQKKNSFAASLGLNGSQVGLLKPSIPAPRPSKAEADLIDNGYRAEHSEIKVEEDRVRVPQSGLCPPSYFFGATGLEGYLRIANFFPLPGEWRIDQTRIRIDRKSQTAAPGAIVTGEQVKPGSVFTGELLIFQERQGTPFGRCRTIGGVEIDLWLKQWTEPDNAKRQLFLLNEILIPALNNVQILGGQKSLGGGKVTISLL
ncbi:MAG: RAMP superfamily CRISPR-associated protein [Nitrospira sp.]|nr:RAMP superfamily CRISPR-associated protein [Nitrospira sp.]